MSDMSFLHTYSVSASGMRCSTVLLIVVGSLCFLHCANLVRSADVHGFLSEFEGDEGNSVAVLAYGRDGKLSGASPVSPRGIFRIHGLSNGVYSLVVVGSVEWAFPPVHVYIKNGVLSGTEQRSDPLLIPGSKHSEARGNGIHFVRMKAIGKAFYLPENSDWDITDLLRNKFLMFQVIGLIFIVTFPRYLKSLDKETLAELTGEEEPDIGDPNQIVKALVGYDEDAENDIVPSILSAEGN